jgi:hypothetical protein
LRCFLVRPESAGLVAYFIVLWAIVTGAESGDKLLVLKIAPTEGASLLVHRSLLSPCDSCAGVLNSGHIYAGSRKPIGHMGKRFQQFRVHRAQPAKFVGGFTVVRWLAEGPRLKRISQPLGFGLFSHVPSLGRRA